MRRGCRDLEVGARPRERQLDGLPALGGGSLLGCQGRTGQLASALRFLLLELDVLALEPSCHKSGYPGTRPSDAKVSDPYAFVRRRLRGVSDALIYAVGMTTARDLTARWPALDVAGRRARLQNSFQVAPGPLADAMAADMSAVEQAAAGIWSRNPSVWSDDAAVLQKIANRLGWLASPELMAESVNRLRAFAESVRRDRISDVVLLGMGGSSLAPEVLRAVLGVAPDWPCFHMVDSTDPAAVRAMTMPSERTLYLLSSKSGTTIEPNVLAAHFRGALEHAGVTQWARHFVAITDEGTALAQRARAQGYRDLFINPGDIGGRYSAVSFFGLVPAALMGLNVQALVGWSLAMLSAAEPGFGSMTENPAVALGHAIGSAARAGRDKLTLIMQPALEPFGLWIEQLIAESTGKLGTGIIPIAGERLADPSESDHDRMFVRIRIHGSYAEEMLDTDIRDLKAAKAPVAEIELAGPSGARCRIRPMGNRDGRRRRPAPRQSI